MIGGRPYTRYFKVFIVLGLVLSIMAMGHGMATAGLAACLNSGGPGHRALAAERCTCCGGEQAARSASSCCTLTGVPDSGDELFVSSIPGIENVALNVTGPYESVTPISFPSTDGATAPLVRQAIYLSNLNLLR